MKACEVTIFIREKDATLDVTPHQWDDNGKPLPDMSDEDFTKLYESVKGKTRFYIDLHCKDKIRSIRSPLASDKDRKFVLSRVVTEVIGQCISAQFDNLCK